MRSVHFQGMAFLWPFLAWFWHRVVARDVGCGASKQKYQIQKKPSQTESSFASIDVHHISSVLPSRGCMIFRKMKNDSIRNTTQKWKRRHTKSLTSNLNLTWRLVSSPFQVWFNDIFCWKHQSSVWTPHVSLEAVAGLWPICWWITAVSLTNALMVVRHTQGFHFGGWGCSTVESTL